MLFDLNFEARFGILSSFSIYQDHICYYFHVLNFWPSYVNTKTSKSMRQIQVLIDFAKNATDGHQMDQTMGKTVCSAKNQNFGIFEMAWCSRMRFYSSSQKARGGYSRSRCHNPDSKVLDSGDLWEIFLWRVGGFDATEFASPVKTLWWCP